MRPDKANAMAIGVRCSRLGSAMTIEVEAEADRYRWIVESALDYAVLTINSAGVITSWNPGAERLLGWSAAEAIGMPWTALFTPEDIAGGAPHAEMDSAAREGRVDEERWHVGKDGSRVWTSDVLMPLPPSHPRVDGFIKILRDRTAAKRLEDERNALIEELQRAEVARDQL